jgi:hypothetical protein
VVPPSARARSSALTFARFDASPFGVSAFRAVPTARVGLTSRFAGASADMPSAMRVRRGGVRAKGEGLTSARADVTAGAIEGVPFGTSGNF